MLTNIEIDDAWLVPAMRAAGQSTKRTTVEEAPRRVVASHRWLPVACVKDSAEQTQPRREALSLCFQWPADTVDPARAAPNQWGRTLATDDLAGPGWDGGLDAIRAGASG